MCNVGTSLLLLSFAFFREQMLQAVMAVHEQNVVHTDLKPANFVLVKGRLKIIDFGIAKAIANDTVNIHRDQQVGTVNYMSPEAIQKENGQNKLKVSQEAIASIVTLPLTLRSLLAVLSLRRLESRMHPLPNGIRRLPIPACHWRSSGQDELHRQSKQQDRLPIGSSISNGREP
jgi:serine/threonine protein kinase